METVAETADRCGIPPGEVEDLIEHPKVAELLVTARDNPGTAPEALMAELDLPTCDPTGLDFEKLRRELGGLRALAERGEGPNRSVEDMQGPPLLMGRMQRAEHKVLRLEGTVAEAIRVLDQRTPNPARALEILRAAK